MALGGGGGGGASARDVRAGGAFVEIFSKNAMLYKGLAAAEKRVAQTGKFFAEIGSKALAAGTVILAPLGALFAKAVDGAAQLDDLADAFGTTTEKLSPLAHAFKVAGLGLEDLERAMKEVAKNDKSGRPVEDVLAEWAIALNDIEDPAERVRKALDQFGKAGVNIAKIAPDLAKLMSGAPIISSEDAKSAEKFQQEMAKIGITLQAAVMPAVGWFAMMAGQASAWASANTGLVATIAAVGAGLVAAGVAAWALGAAFSGVAVAIGVASAALGIFGGLLSFILSPIGLVVAAVGGLVGVWATMTNTGQAAMRRLGGLFGELAGTAKTGWAAVVAAIQKGDLELAFEVVSKGVRFVWFTLIEFLEAEWDRFKAGWKDGLRELLNEVVRLAKEAKQKLLDIVPKREDFVWAIRDTFGLEDNRRTIASPETLRRFKAGHPSEAAPWVSPADMAIGGIMQALTRAMNLTPKELAEAAFNDAVRRAMAPVGKPEAPAPIGSPVAQQLVGLPNQVKGMFGAMNTQQAFGFADENRQVKEQRNIARKVEEAKGVMESIDETLDAVWGWMRDRKEAVFA